MTHMVPPRISGVYAIRHISSGKRYVGSATRCFKERWRSHRCDLRAGRHHSKRLQNAWDKHGEDAFVFEIVEVCDKTFCLDVEQCLMDFYRSADREYGYNICRFAGNCVGHVFSEESRAKMSKSQTGKKRSAESIAKSAAGNRGQKRTPEIRAKMSAALTGRKMPDGFGARVSAGKTNPSQETREKLRLSHLGKKLSAESKAKRSATIAKKKRIQQAIDLQQP